MWRHNNQQKGVEVHSCGGSAVRLGRALPGFSITAPLVCIPAVLGGLAVWRHNNRLVQTPSKLESARASEGGVGDCVYVRDVVLAQARMTYVVQAL